MTAFVNLINDSLPITDRELFFGPLEKDETFIEFDNSHDLADIMVMAGKFPSKSQARKNGYNSSIPKGFSTIVCGKGRNRMELFILNQW